MKVKNDVGESSQVFDTITLNELLTGGVTGKLYDGPPDKAKVLAGAAVSCGGKTGTTSTTGTFTLTGIDPGTYDLTFTKTGYLPLTVRAVSIVKGVNTNTGDNSLIKELIYTYTALLPTGWSYAETSGINNSNKVVGTGFDSAYNNKVFTFTPYVLPNITPLLDIVSVSIADSGALLLTGTDQYGEWKDYLISGTIKRLLSPPRWSYSEAWAINSKSNVIGYGIDENGYDSAYLYFFSSNTYQTLLPPGWSYADVWEISNNDQVLGFGTDSAGMERFYIYSGGSYTEMSPPGSEDLPQPSAAMNNNGTVAFITYDELGVYSIFVYSNGDYTEIPSPAATLDYIMISDNGDFIVTSIDEAMNFTSYLYSGGQFTELAIDGKTSVQALKINSQGQVLFEVYDDLNGYTYFVRSGDQLVEIYPPDWLWGMAVTMNDKGAVVGYGTDANGFDKGFLAIPK